MCQGFLPREFKAIKQSQMWDFRWQRKVLVWTAVGGGGDSGGPCVVAKADTPWNPLGCSLDFFYKSTTIFFFFFFSFICFLFFKKNLIGGLLLYNIGLVSAIHQHESAIDIHISR